jgi:hypothetical protein
MILNLAVGGNWPGNPDETTMFAENARLVVDNVKVYQEKKYDENVEKPVAATVSRVVDENGNYVRNSDFSAEISGGMLNIATSDCGELEYSVQVMQPNIFLEKGYGYKFSFDAWADADRTIIPAITALSLRSQRPPARKNPTGSR